MHKPFLRTVGMVTVAAALVSGCFGGGDDDNAGTTPPPTATTDVPGSALDSVSGLLAYLTTLIGSNSDAAEPVLVGTAVLPTSDTTEPAN